MYTLFTITKNKKNTRGYWINDKKLYRDNIIKVKCKNKIALKSGTEKLFLQGEKAVFFTIKNRGFCVEKKSGKIASYKKRLRLRHKKINRKLFKNLIKNYGGLTVYKLDKRYILEVFYN